MLAAAALGTVLAGAGADSAAALWQSVSRRPHLSRGLLRWELGDLLGLDGLSAATVLALGQSPVLLAVHDGQPGGTRRTMEYAMRRGLQIVDIPPVMEP